MTHPHLARDRRDTRTKHAKRQHDELAHMYHRVSYMAQHQDIRNTVEQEVYDQFALIQRRHDLATLWAKHHPTVNTNRRYSR